jgi:hypothetical protein
VRGDLDGGLSIWERARAFCKEHEHENRANAWHACTYS